jgi:S-DNA-T family DNA segregation ATPase FtsK/SpoIIIE
LSSDQAQKLTGAQRLLEAGLLFSCAFAFFLILALLSFDAADPSWSQTGYHAPVRNLGGAVGAYLSDIIFFTFGNIGYTLPFVIAFIGWLLFQRIHHLLALDYLTLGLKILGFILLYMGLTGIASMNFDDVYYFSAGGVIGDLVSSGLITYFNFIGTSLLLVLFTCAGLVFLTGISFLTMIDFVGEKAIVLALFISQLPAWIKEKFGVSEIAKPKLPKSDKSVAESDDKLTFIDDDEVKADTDVPPFEHDNFMADVELGDDPLFTEPKENTQKEPESPGFSALDSNEFVEIDELMGGPLDVNVQEVVDESEITAALTPVEKVEVSEQEPVSSLPVADSSVFNKYDGFPSIDLLDRPDKATNPIDPAELEQISRLVEAKLLDFNIEAKVVNVLPGPVITMLELELAPGVKVSKISNLSKDLARSMSVISVRVVEVIPGKSVIGLEIPNKHREIVHFSEVVACDAFAQSPSSLTMVLGKDISGDAVVVDLAKMPHLLVAGTTGSGKSVGVNTMIVSLLYKSSPEDVRLIMIDPKMLELSVYEGIPHLLTEVVTDMKDAANALRWCVGEMERRYKLMSALGVRNLKGYNQKVKQAQEAGEPLCDPLWKAGDSMDETAPELDKLPSIVVVVDEFADMIMVVGKKVEELIARIAQKARAAGIHLIIATQRPDTNVITGLIKANIPTRMAFQVQGRVNSRVILDQQGAEQLLGMGDMLYLPPGKAVPTRVHGAFIDDHEVHAVVNDWKSRGEPNYLDEILSGEMTQDTLLPGEQAEGEDQELDALYDEALAFVTETRKASISGVQRKFRIGYNRAARLIEQMEASGVVSSPGHNGNREVLAPPPVKA